MRLIAFFVTAACLCLAALAGYQLWQVLQHSTGVRELATAQNSSENSQTDPPQSGAETQSPRPWPALFGEKQPPRPAAAPQKPEPQPPTPDLPPLESLGYVLKGRVQAGSSTWAIVDHPSGEQLLRQGDALRADIKVVRIDAEGLWVSRRGAAPELLGFAQ